MINLNRGLTTPTHFQLFVAEAYASAIQYEKTKQKHATEEVKKQKI